MLIFLVKIPKQISGKRLEVSPRGIIKPQSKGEDSLVPNFFYTANFLEDVQQILDYCGTHRLVQLQLNDTLGNHPFGFLVNSRIAVVARGRGHCVEGQSLCDGFVIDTTNLCKVITVTDQWVDIEAGAAYDIATVLIIVFFPPFIYSPFFFFLLLFLLELSIVCRWTDVIEVTASHGKMPLLMPSSWFLSVGGLTSVGGMTCMIICFIQYSLSLFLFFFHELKLPSLFRFGNSGQ